MGVVIALVMSAILSPARAAAVSSSVSLDIPPQSLSSALTSLANQADLQILFSQELVAGLRAPALSGTYSATQALQRLLHGANLEFVVRGHDTVVIRARNTLAPRRPSL